MPRPSAIRGAALVRLELGLALAWQASRPTRPRPWGTQSASSRPPSAVRARPPPPEPPPDLPPFVAARPADERGSSARLLRGAAFQQALRTLSGGPRGEARGGARAGRPEAAGRGASALYDKDRPALAFSRLGPLARRFPHAQTVRFHLGLS